MFLKPYKIVLKALNQISKTWNDANLNLNICKLQDFYANLIDYYIRHCFSCPALLLLSSNKDSLFSYLVFQHFLSNNALSCDLVTLVIFFQSCTCTEVCFPRVFYFLWCSFTFLMWANVVLWLCLLMEPQFPQTKYFSL